MNLDNSVIDPRVRRYVWPSRVVWSEGVAADANARLLSKGQLPLAVRATAGGPSFVLDFGRELHGGIQIENGVTGDHAPVRVRVRFGESVSEVMGHTDNDHSVHEVICYVPWYGAVEAGSTGFRFVRVDLLDEGTELILNKVRAVFLYRDLAYKGSFRCNDERLNRIWETGAYTVHLCMQDMLWDGAKRDRLVWIGDMHPETSVISAVFGEVDVVPKSLDFVRDQTPLPNWMNGISSYSLWWLLIQHSWFLHHGNRTYLEEQRTYLVGLLRQLQTQIADNGSEVLGDWRFLDWPSSEDKPTVHAGLHALLALAFDAGADLCKTLGETEQEAACRAAHTKMQTYAPAATAAKQANALLALAKLADAGDTNRLVLAVEPLRGLSTFYGYYVLQARAKAGDYANCLETIRRYWGAMLDLGATTFWEDFNLDWTENAAGIEEVVPTGKKDIHGDFGNYCYKGLRHSLCHGWASGPTAWLSEHVLGFRPLEPGCTTLLVEPHLGDLEFAEGSFPTPAGVVKVSHRKGADGGVRTRISAPGIIKIVATGCQVE